MNQGFYRKRKGGKDFWVLEISSNPKNLPTFPLPVQKKPRLFVAVMFAAALCQCRAKDQDLMPKSDLAGWRRVPIEPLAQKPVWTMGADGKTLVIEGVGAKEMLLYDKELGDGVLHVEWRFRKVEESDPAKKVVYNGGVYARTTLDGKVYVQAQVAHQDKAPVVGDVIAQVPGKKERVNVYQRQRAPSARSVSGTRTISRCAG